MIDIIKYIIIMINSNIKIHTLSNRNMILIQNDCITDKIMEGYEPWITDLIMAHVKPGDICIDIGANCGYHTLTMGNAVGDNGMVFAFEPQRIIFQQLSGNIFLNQIFNVATFNTALGDKNDIVGISTKDFVNTKTNCGDTRIHLNMLESKECVERRRLDDMLPEIAKLDFMKIDAQGSELMILQGAKMLIDKWHPKIIIEIEWHQLAHFQITQEILLNYLRNDLGYSVVSLPQSSDYFCEHV